MNLFDITMISGGFFSLVLFAGILISKGKKRIDWIVAIIFLCHSNIVIFKGIATSGLVLRFPWTMHLDLYMFYLIGPCLFFFLKVFSDKDFHFKKQHLLHLIPLVVAILLYIPFYRIPVADRLELFPYYKKAEGLLLYFYGASYLLPSVLVPIYVLAGLRDYPKLSHLFKSTEKGALLCIAFLVVEAALFSVLMFLAYFNWSWNIYRFIMNGLNQIVLFYYLMNQRYPQLYDHLRKEVRQYRELLHLNEEDIGKLKKDLLNLMEEEKIYTETDLNLSELSERLSINTHQLSELLNKILKVSFKSMINKYRIDHVKELIKTYPEKKILEIAFESGFRSKSAFNTLFVKTLGCSPSEYKKNLKK